MSYKIYTSPSFEGEFKKLDKYTQILIRGWIKKHLENSEIPEVTGEKMTEEKSDLWRYRIGEYRIICKIENDEMIILMLRIGHEGDICC